MTVEDRAHTKMQDQDILADCLSTLKYLSSCYQHAAVECDSQDLRGVFRNILNDKMELQAATFQMMNQRGWYNPARAEAENVQKTSMQFQDSYKEIMNFYQQ